MRRSERRCRIARIVEEQIPLRPRGNSVQELSKVEPRHRPRPDWRGWIALVWVIGWGWAYGTMVFQARAPQLLTWLRAFCR
jgi:hypothetical protein